MGYNVNIINSEATVTTTVVEYPVNVSVDDLTFNVNTTEVNVGVTNVDTTVTLYTNAIELLVDDFNNYFMGDWVSGQTYRRGQLVDYANSLFVCSTGTLTSVTTTVNPAISPANQWRRVVWHEAPFDYINVTNTATVGSLVVNNTATIQNLVVNTAMDHLTITNHLSAGSLSVGTASGSGLNVQGNMYLSGTSTFANTATFLSDLVIGGGVGGNGLRINGPATFNGTATFNSTVNMSTASLTVGTLTAAGVLYPQDAGAFGQVLYTNGTNIADWINLGELVLWSLASDLTTNGFDIVTGYSGNQANNPRLRIGSGNDTNLAAYIDFPGGGESIIFTATTVNTVAGSGGINLTSIVSGASSEINLSAGTNSTGYGSVNIRGGSVNIRDNLSQASLSLGLSGVTPGVFKVDANKIELNSRGNDPVVDPSVDPGPAGGWPQFNIKNWNINAQSSFLQTNNIGVAGYVKFSDGTTQTTAAGAGGIGYTGSRGDTGGIGYSGSLGYSGSRGTSGYTGSIGAASAIGYTGSQGIPGDYAAMGYTGSAGYWGSRGYTGSIGAASAIGYTGSVGGLGLGVSDLYAQASGVTPNYGNNIDIALKTSTSFSTSAYNNTAIGPGAYVLIYRLTEGTDPDRIDLATGTAYAQFVDWYLSGTWIGVFSLIDQDNIMPPYGSTDYYKIVLTGAKGPQGYTGSMGTVSGNNINIITSTGTLTLSNTATIIGSSNQFSQLNVQKIYNYAGTNAPQFPAGMQFPDSTIQVTAFTTQTLGLYLIDFGVI